jgi:NADH dehydrogenase [ubiquinone] 1 alpha subcomplex assembly factor 7
MGAMAQSFAVDPENLAAHLRERIRRDGPLTVADYMQACISDTREGVYAARQPIGERGDFITAPEISQVFGELLGVWCIAVWQSMDEPEAITVAELGPGRGTLMADVLRAWHPHASFLDRVSIALVETNPIMRDAQRRALSAAPVPLAWHQHLDEVPSGPLVMLANEFIDALPIHQLVQRGQSWHERVVALDVAGNFIFAEGASIHDESLPPAPDGTILETRPAAPALIASLAHRAREAPLGALIIDYGPEEWGFGDTLQAVARHRFADPLAAPGEADVSAQVDFAGMKREAERLGMCAYGPMPQGAFLLKLGLGPRRERVLTGATAAQITAIESGIARLVDPQQMGVLFKALALTSDGLPPPPPF